jgi:hypothetical protein
VTETNNFFVGLVSNLFSAVVTVFSLFFVFNIYEALSTKKTLSEITYDNTFKFGYGFLMLVSVVMIGLFIAAVSLAIFSNNTMFEELRAGNSEFMNSLNTEELKERAQNLE